MQSFIVSDSPTLLFNVAGRPRRPFSNHCGHVPWNFLVLYAVSHILIEHYFTHPPEDKNKYILKVNKNAGLTRGSGHVYVLVPDLVLPCSAEAPRRAPNRSPGTHAG